MRCLPKLKSLDKQVAASLHEIELIVLIIFQKYTELDIWAPHGLIHHTRGPYGLAICEISFINDMARETHTCINSSLLLGTYVNLRNYYGAKS